MGNKLAGESLQWKNKAGMSGNDSSTFGDGSGKWQSLIPTFEPLRIGTEMMTPIPTFESRS